MTINQERAKNLIKHAAKYLAEAELLEENGWTEEDKAILEHIADEATDFEVNFK